MSQLYWHGGEVETQLGPFRRSGLVSPLDLYSNTVNKDGSRKMSCTVPHHQAVIDGGEWLAHLTHLPTEARESDARFQRYHSSDHEEAVRFCAALCDKGGFGTVINKSVRIMGYWREMAEVLVSDCETGPVELSECDAPYDTPRVEVRVDLMHGAEHNPRVMGGNR